MLIYNYQKEFLGIDEVDLELLGFANLAQLRLVAADFADLFVKTPGYVQNFEGVSWIDYVVQNEYNTDYKVVILANEKFFKATLDIKTSYLVDNPSQKAYLVYLNNFIQMSPQESEDIQKNMLQKPIPQSTSASNPIFNAPEFTHPKQMSKDTTKETLSHVVEEDVQTMPQEAQGNSGKDAVVLDDFKSFDLQESSQPLLENVEKEYVYNPEIAAKALKLPVDLIEEFLQDFILQAREFQNDLYSSVEEKNFSNIKILSHKLKGVAANLRIEDALDTLSVINASSDADEIRAHLNIFYKIVDKLSGDEGDTTEFLELKEDEVTPVQQTPQEVALKSDEDEYILDFKEDNEESTEVKSFTKQEASYELGIDLETYDELLDEYLDEAISIASKINDAILDGDYLLWREEAIKLQGATNNMRVEGFSDEIETIIHTQDSEVVKEAIKNIIAYLDTISTQG